MSASPPADPPSLLYRCARCDKPVVSYEAIIRPDGKLQLTGSCHGERFVRVLYLGIGGVVFEDGSTVSYPTAQF